MLWYLLTSENRYTVHYFHQFSYWLAPEHNVAVHLLVIFKMCALVVVEHALSIFWTLLGWALLASCFSHPWAFLGSSGPGRWLFLRLAKQGLGEHPGTPVGICMVTVVGGLLRSAGPQRHAQLTLSRLAKERSSRGFGCLGCIDLK